MLFPTEEDTEEKKKTPKNKILALQQVFLKHGKVHADSQSGVEMLMQL